MTRATTSAPRARLTAEVRAWRNAVIMIFIVSGLFLSTWISRVPGVRDSLHLSTDVVGLILLGVSIGAIVGLVVAPPLQARVGTRVGLGIVAVIAGGGVAIVGVGTVAGALPVVIVGLALLGLGNGAMDVMMNVSAAAVEKRIGRTVMPFMHACFSIGTVVGAAIGAVCAALGVSVFWHFSVMAVITVGVALFVVRYIPNSQDMLDQDAAAQASLDAFDDPAVAVAPRRRTFGETVKSQFTVWADWRLVLIGVVMLGMSFAEGSANDWIALGSVDGHGLTNAGGALVLGVFVAAMTIGRLLGGPMVDRMGRVWSIRVTAGLGIVGLLAFILMPAPVAYITGVVLWGMGASLGFPLGMSAAADDRRNATARVSAVAMIGYLSFLAGPPIIGFLGQQVGILNALFVVLVLLVAAFVCAPALRHRDPSSPGSTSGADTHRQHNPA